ncbi:MAG: hypothetical protein CMM00_14990 [Rhodopirellula sp.]|nr:hypothetical protein [Rhodopirellula sp.]
MWICARRKIGDCTRPVLRKKRQSVPDSIGGVCPNVYEMGSTNVTGNAFFKSQNVVYPIRPELNERYSNWLLGQ